MGSPATGPTSSAQTVQICLKANVSDPKLRAAHNAALTVPASVGRKALSSILQKLLSLPEVVPFHFLVDDEPFRTTFDKFLFRRNRTAEQTLVVVYYLPLPEPESSPPHQVSDQWLAAVHAASPDLILAGGYTSAPTVLSGDSVLPESSCDPHAAGIKGVSWLPDHSRFLTASLDRTARLWSFSADPLSAAPVAELRTEDAGHPASFSCVAVRGDAAALGTDNGSIWYVPSFAVERFAAPAKRPRVQSLPSTRLAALPTPLPISSVAWTKDALVTVGWDPLARFWDIEKCAATVSVPCGGKAVTGVSIADKLLVSAVDGGVRLLDHREGRGVVGACGRKGAHRGVVADVKWMCDNTAVSAGFDGTLRFWDVRSFMAPSRLVESVHGGGRCLAVDAVRDGEQWTVVSVGKDGKVAKFLL